MAEWERRRERRTAYDYNNPADSAVSCRRRSIRPSVAQRHRNPAPDLTGSYLGNAAAGQQPGHADAARDSRTRSTTRILIQGTPQEWEQIRSLLRQLDVAPRQVLIDAKIYELDLTGAFSAGVQPYLEKQRYRAREPHA